MKILVVDDDLSSRASLKGNLEALGHEVIETPNGEEAWEVFQGEDVQIVVTDWVMPGINGPELCRRIRSEQRSGYVYVLVLSALRGGEMSYLEAMDAGADDFVSKPIGREEMAARIRVVQRIEGLRREVQTLRSILPICSYCKKIRTDDDAWASIEAYLTSQRDISLSHGICPDCLESEVEPQFDRFSGEG